MKKRLGAAAAGALVLGGCASAPLDAGGPAKPAARQPADPAAPRGAKWVITSADSMGRPGSDGLVRSVLAGRRVVLDGRRLVKVIEQPSELSGALPFGAAPSASAPYVFWSGGDVSVAPSFEGKLVPKARLGAEVLAAFPWLSGVGLRTARQMLALVPGGAAPVEITEPCVAEALADGGSRGVLVNAFGRAKLTVDGGKTWRDLGRGFVDVSRGKGEGAELVLRAAGGEELRVAKDGSVAPHVPAEAAGVVDEDVVIGALGSSATLSADGAIVLARKTLARVDASTGALLAQTELDVAKVLGAEEGAAATCVPFAAPDDVLVLCRTPTRDVALSAGADLREERSFPVAARDRGAPAVESLRFVGVDGEALGYVGPCGALDAPAEAVARDQVLPNAGPVFCVRAGANRWVEHRVDAADAAHLEAWVPERGGGAVALITRPGSSLGDELAVEQRGDLRVVRVARGAPPLSFPSYRYRSSYQSVVDRALRVRADGGIEGFAASESSNTGVASLAIDASGRVAFRPFPGFVQSLGTSGPRALLVTDAGTYFQSLDAGASWRVVEPPPIKPERPSVDCGAAGCRMGTFTRIGWSRPSDPEPPRDDIDASRDPAKRQGTSVYTSYRAPARSELPAVKRLACKYTGPLDGGFRADSSLLGTSSAGGSFRYGSTRIGTFGLAVMPGSGSSGSNDLEIAFTPPFELSTALKITTLPGSIVPSNARYYEVRLGPVLSPSGGLALVAYGDSSVCAAPWLQRAGITPWSECAPESSIGVEHDGRTLLLNPFTSQLSVLRGAGSAGDALAPAKAKSAAAAKAKAAKAAASASASALAAASPTSGLASLVGPGGSLSGASATTTGPTAWVAAQAQLLTPLLFPPNPGGPAWVGVGLRDGEPVVVVVDRAGRALAAAFDTTAATYGQETELAPLSGLLGAGHAKCAPEPGEARVVLVARSENMLPIELDLPSVVPSLGYTSAATYVLRWSKSRACLELADIPSRDERVTYPGNSYGSEIPTKVIVKFGARDKSGKGVVSTIKAGIEARQGFTCEVPQ